MTTRFLLAGVAMIVVTLLSASALASEQPQFRSPIVQVGHLQFYIDRIDETITIELPSHLLFTEPAQRVARVRITLDGVTTNELTLLDLVEAQTRSTADNWRGESQPLPMTVSVTNPELLVVAGRYLLEVTVVKGDGSEELLLSREDLFSSAYLNSLQYRLRFANAVLDAQMKAAERAIEVFEHADPTLFEPDSSGVSLLYPGYARMAKRDLASGKRVLASWPRTADSEILEPAGPVVEREFVQKLVSERERAAYDENGAIPGGRMVVRMLLRDVGRDLDRVNTRLTQNRMELEDYSSRTQPTDLEKRHIEELKVWIAKLEQEQRLLSELYLDIERLWIATPAFAGGWLEQANS